MFKLEEEPLAFQLSVHFRNYQSYYGKGSFVADFNKVCINPNMDIPAAMRVFVAHYGTDYIRSFIRDVLLHRSAA